jgi:hypothetical protein
VHKNGAECVVLGAVFRFFASCHWLQPVRDKGTGQGTWDLTDFSKRRNLSAKNSGGTAAAVPKFCGRAGARPSKLLFATRYSLLAIRCRFTIRRSHSLLAIRHSPIAIRRRFQFSMSLAFPSSSTAKFGNGGEEGEMACGKFGFQFDCKQPLRNALDCSRLAWA